MVQSLGDALNRAHERFTARNPQFSGKVSVMGHSLGSIITYDILCNQPHLYSRLGVDIHEPLHPGIIFPDLNFPGEPT